MREFHFIRQEVDDFRHFDQLMDSGIMQRVRDIKQAFGESFYHPRVLATVAEYNVFFGSRFDQLFHQATRQIKTFAARVQEEGGSVMSRVEGDMLVKQLAEVEENEILQTEYGRAQESFRQVSRMKKAVDRRRANRVVRMPAMAPANLSAQPARAPTPVELPIAAGRDLIEESKIVAMQDTIRNFVRAADPESSRVVPLRHGNISLSTAEVEAYRAEFGAEKSFRADCAATIRQMVALHALMTINLEGFRAKQRSSYLWKPHADSLAYLLATTARCVEACGGLSAVAEERGLTAKVNALNASLQRLRMAAQDVAKTLGGLT